MPLRGICPTRWDLLRPLVQLSLWRNCFHFLRFFLITADKARLTPGEPEGFDISGLERGVQSFTSSRRCQILLTELGTTSANCKMPRFGGDLHGFLAAIAIE